MTNSLSIHTKNLHLLVIEIFEFLNHLSPEVMWDSFIVKPNSYYLIGKVLLWLPLVRLLHELYKLF